MFCVGWRYANITCVFIIHQGHYAFPIAYMQHENVQRLILLQLHELVAMEAERSQKLSSCICVRRPTHAPYNIAGDPPGPDATAVYALEFHHQFFGAD